MLFRSAKCTIYVCVCRLWKSRRDISYKAYRSRIRRRYDEIRAFKAIPRNHKFAEAKEKERNNLMSTSMVNYHRTSHHTDTPSKTICEQNNREHLTSHDTVAPDCTSDCTRWGAWHGGRSEDCQRTTLRQYHLTTMV